jgi:phosphonate transport system ATP-binding protein
MNNAAITINGLNKSFGAKRALSDIHLTIAPGEFVALIGPSGSGKSTLLRHTSGLIAGDKDSGSVTIFGRTVQECGRIKRQIREIRTDVGFIFQQFNLVNRLTLLQNVLVGMVTRVPTWRSLLRIYTRSEKLSAMRSLYRVGLHEHVLQRAGTLSGGQQQRAAIARAMEQRAKIILADEPIASLDPESARLVMESLAQLNREDNVTIVISLHQVQFALQYCCRSVAMKDGKIIFDGPSSKLSPELLRQIYGTSVDTTIDGTAPLTAKKKAIRDVLHDNKRKKLMGGLAEAGV